MAAVIAAGKALAWGVSNYASWQILEMVHLCDARKMPRPTISQALYNALIRELDVEHFAFAKKHGVHVTVYNPLAGGLLSGRHERARDGTKGSRFDKNALYLRRYWTEAMFDRVDELKKVADAERLSLVDLSYAWVASRPGVDSIVVGPASVEQLDAAIAGCDKTLSPDALARIDELDRTWRGTDSHYVR
jgi:aryl-alcohol dehydrogenase-like predicted oxidoreductase